MSKTASQYYSEACNLKNAGKYEEAILVYRKCHEVDPKYSPAFRSMGNTYMLLEKHNEAIEMYKKALENNDERALETEVTLGQMYQETGRFEQALVHYNNVLAKNPREYRGLINKAHLMFETGKTQESKVIYEQVYGIWASVSARTYCRGAKMYEALGMTEKAKECYIKGSKNSPSDCDGYSHRGVCWMALGEKEKAFADFKKAEELLVTDTVTNNSPGEVRFVRETLKRIFESEAMAVKAQEAMKTLGAANPNSSVVKNFIANIKNLQDQNTNVQSKLINQLAGKENAETTGNMNAMDSLKAEFDKKLAEMAKEMAKLTNQVNHIEKEVKEMKNNMEEMKEELNNKLTDYEKKLSAALDKQDLKPEEKEKLLGYFHAFVQTFSSAHVTAQVVDSGQVQLDSDSSAATVLSMVASFAPFVGSVLSSGIKSLGDFLKSQEMQKNARKLKGLATDATKLSQIIGEAAYEILLDKEKQKSVIATTEKDLAEISGSMFQKIAKFCDNISEKIDVALYTALYSTPAERVGHNDANDLIDKFLNRTIVGYDIKSQFVKEILNPKKEGQSANPGEPTQTPARSGCCTMF